MIRLCILLVLAMGLFGCQRHYAEPRMLEEPPYIPGHEPPEVVPQRLYFDVDVDTISTSDLLSVFADRPVADVHPSFASQAVLIRQWSSVERPICGGGPHLLYGDTEGDVWLQVAEGFTGRVAWYGPIHVDEIRQLAVDR